MLLVASNRVFLVTPTGQNRLMAGRWRCRAARAVAWIDDGWRRWLGMLGAWAALGAVVTVVLVATTIYYAVQTKHLVDEARSARQREEARHSERLLLERHREIEGTVAALQGALLDVVKSGSMLLTMRRLDGVNGASVGFVLSLITVLDASACHWSSSAPHRQPTARVRDATSATRRCRSPATDVGRRPLRS